jgi:hypothetical protein
MAMGTIQTIISAGGISISSSVSKAANGTIGQDPTLNAANAGDLTTRTDNTSGVLTMDDSNHGITNAAIFDLHWVNSEVPQCAYGCVADSVAGNSIGFNVTGGDVLPAANTAINAQLVTTVDVDFDGDLLEMIAIGANVAAHVTFRDAGDNVLMARTIGANAAWQWAKNNGDNNPLTGNAVAYVEASCGSAANGTQIKIAGIYDSVS